MTSLFWMLAVLAFADTVIAACPSGWTFYATTNACYRVFGPPYLNYDAATQACKTEGGIITTPKSIEDVDFVFSVSQKPTWLGLDDKATEGTFRWQDGAVMTYANWADGEPSDPQGTDDCVGMGFSKTWYDQSCDIEAPYVCQIPSCPSGWTFYAKTSACYRAFGPPYLNYDAATQACKTEGGNITTPKSIEEVDFVYSVSQKPTWLGLDDKTTEGTFRWQDGTVLTYANWADGEPTDSLGLEDCVGMGFSKTWYEESCEKEAPYVCQIPSTTTG